jgi:hypothetical protein
MDEDRGDDRKQYSDNEGRQSYDQGHERILSALGNSCGHRSQFGNHDHRSSLAMAKSHPNGAWLCTVPVPLIRGPASLHPSDVCCLMRGDGLRYVFQPRRKVPLTPSPRRLPRHHARVWKDHGTWTRLATSTPR